MGIRSRGFGIARSRGFAVAAVAYVLTLCFGVALSADAQRTRRTAAGGSCGSYSLSSQGTTFGGNFRNPGSTAAVAAYCTVTSDTYLGHHEATSLFVGGNNQGHATFGADVGLQACVRSLSGSSVSCGVRRDPAPGPFFVSVDVSAWTSMPSGVPYLYVWLPYYFDSVTGWWFSAP